LADGIFFMRTKRNEEARLKHALQASAALSCLGCKFHRGLTGGIILTLGGRSIGIWKFEKSKFFFFETFLSEPVQSAEQVEDALSFTTTMVVASRQCLTI
jgi:hypothetical protein